MRSPLRATASLLLGLLASVVACDRVPEQALRDEQSRSRKYREAFESEHDENVALRARLEKLDKPDKQSCETPAPPAR